MENILNMLYRGEIHPEETYQPVTPELIEVRDAFIAHRDALFAELDEEIRVKVQELFEERTFVSSYEIEDAYVQGMKMGARMITALLGEEKERKDRF